MKTLLISLLLSAHSAHAAKIGDTIQVPREAISCTQRPQHSPCFGCPNPPISFNADVRLVFSVDQIPAFSGWFTNQGCAKLDSLLPPEGLVDLVVTKKVVGPPIGQAHWETMELTIGNFFPLEGHVSFPAQAAIAASSEQPAQTISGVARKTGTQPGDCSFAPPPASDAEKDANDQAVKACGALKAVRVSRFSYSENNCVWGGPQYRYATDTLYAQAEYRCD